MAELKFPIDYQICQEKQACSRPVPKKGRRVSGAIVYSRSGGTVKLCLAVAGTEGCSMIV